MSDLVIRPSEPADAESFRTALDIVCRERRYLAMLEAPPVENVRAFVENLIKTGGVQLVALEGERVVGWCDIQASPLEGFRHSGVLGMGLLPTHRGRGLGRRLLFETLARASQLGMERVELQVFDDNAPAIALYETLGFRHEGLKVDARRLNGRSQNMICMAWRRDT